MIIWIHTIHANHTEFMAPKQKKRKLLHTTQLPIAQINIKNQNNKCGELQYILEQMKPKPLVVGISETWERNQQDEEYMIKNYSWFGKPRGDGRGGVGLWIHDKISARVSITAPSISNPNIIWVKFVGDKITTHIAVIYSRPNHPKRTQTNIKSPRFKHQRTRAEWCNHTNGWF